MGPNNSAKKQPAWYEQDEVVKPEKSAVPAWMADDEVVGSKFNPDDIDVNYNAPAGVRMEVGALEKPEDRLAAVQKHYPDAEPHGDDNFIMSDPATGKTMLYKPEGWRIPTVGDLASILPEAAEGVGAGVGGIAGGLLGGASGSVIPLAGTAAGGVAGAMTGAGVGGAAAKDAVQRGINYLYGNADTRTLADYAKDKALDVAVNGLGEGAGMAVAKGAQMAATPFKAMFAGGLPNATKNATAKELGQYAADAGIKPTVGMVTQSPGALSREATIAARKPNSYVGQAQQALNDSLDQQFRKITSGIASATDPAGRVLSWQGAGEGIQKAANDARTMLNNRLNTAYADVDAAVGNVPATSNASVQAHLAALNAEKKGLSASEKINKGAAIDQAIDQAKAVNADLKKGMTFGQGQDIRSTIGGLAFSKDADPVFAARMKNLYGALSNDLGDTAKSVGGDVFDKWKAADALNTSKFSDTGPLAGLNPLLKAKSGQDAMNALTRGINDGDKNLSLARQSIEASGGAPAYDQAVATMLSDMGMRTSDATGAQVFSPDKFFQTFNKVSPEAQSALLGGTVRSQYASDLARLGKMVEMRKASISAKPKDSIIGNDILSQTFAIPGKALAYAYNGYMSKLMTDPVVVKWWTGIPAAQMRKGGMAGQFNVLRNYAREKIKQGTDDGRQTAQAIEQYLNDIGQ